MRRTDERDADPDAVDDRLAIELFATDGAEAVG
jgi:hypothetical protein